MRGTAGRYYFSGGKPLKEPWYSFKVINQDSVGGTLNSAWVFLKSCG